MVFIWRHNELMKKLSVILSVLFALTMSAFPPSIHGIIASSISQGPSYDADAKKFIDSSGITDTIQKRAINTLVVQLKDSSLWSKMICVYPLVGGTASTTKWNLKDPRDLDAAYRITFSGGWTFSNNGANPNGINSVANSHFNPSVSGTLTSQAFGYDSRENVSSSNIDFGVDNNINNIYGYLSYAGQTAYSSIYSASYLNPIRVGSNYFYQVSRVGTNVSVYDNGSLLRSGTLATSSLYNGVIKFGMAGRELDFFYISTGLTASEMLMMYNIVSQFKTDLGI